MLQAGLPFDYFDRTMKAGEQARLGHTAHAAALDAQNLMAYRDKELELKKLELDLTSQYNNAMLEHEQRGPSGGDRILGGIGGAYGGYMAGSAVNALRPGGGSPWLAAGGAILGAIGGMSR